MAVKRWSPHLNTYDEPDMCEAPTGNFVRLSDYEELHEKFRDLERRALGLVRSVEHNRECPTDCQMDTGGAFDRLQEAVGKDPELYGDTPPVPVYYYHVGETLANYGVVSKDLYGYVAKRPEGVKNPLIRKCLMVFVHDCSDTLPPGTEVVVCRKTHYEDLQKRSEEKK